MDAVVLAGMIERRADIDRLGIQSAEDVIVFDLLRAVFGDRVPESFGHIYLTIDIIHPLLV